MLLTINTTAESAADLGFLLHKNPANVFEKEMWFGKIRVFYPHAEERHCTAALLLEVDPIGLVRGRHTGEGLDQYVNDRPYVASSMMSVAIGEAFRTAMTGRSADRQERVEEKMALRIEIAALDCDAGEPLIRDLFEPIGYQVSATRAPLDERFPEWGEGSVYSVALEGNQTVQDALAHLYVLIPVLDNAKHYYVDEAEVEKLLRRGGDWLPAHPQKDLIARRYLRYRHRMVRAALEQLREEDTPDEESQEREEESVEAPVRLNEIRLQSVLTAIRELSPPAASVIDLGCGEGNLLKLLLKEHEINRIVGMDVSSFALARAESRLGLERMPERKRERIQLIHGSLVYKDDRFAGFDAAILVEVIEHLDADRLPALEKVVFQHARPRRAIVTTPNADYNKNWESLPAGRFRHRDHRFEWNREQFRAWSEAVADRFGYGVKLSGVGPDDPDAGCPTQMAVFDRSGP